MSKNLVGMVRRALVVLVPPAMLVAGCGDDDSGASTTSDQDVADGAIAAVEKSLRADGFAPASDGDEGGDLVFESEECRDFDQAFPGDQGGVPGETASAEIEDFERGEPAPGGVQETVQAFAGFVEERDDLDPIFQLLNDERLGRCLEEAFRIGVEKAAAEDQATVAVGDVEIEQLGSEEFGDRGSGVELTGEITASGSGVPFSLAFQGIQVDRALVGIFTSGVGSGEPIADRATLLEILVDGVST
jgi:hypothetical protein